MKNRQNKPSQLECNLGFSSLCSLAAHSPESSVFMKGLRRRRSTVQAWLQSILTCSSSPEVQTPMTFWAKHELGWVCGGQSFPWGQTYFHGHLGFWDPSQLVYLMLRPVGGSVSPTFHSISSFLEVKSEGLWVELSAMLLPLWSLLMTFPFDDSKVCHFQRLVERQKANKSILSWRLSFLGQT